MNFTVVSHSGFSSTESNWNLEMLIFAEGRKPENPEKNPRSKEENQQQTQLTCDTASGNNKIYIFSYENNTCFDFLDRYLIVQYCFSSASAPVQCVLYIFIAIGSIYSKVK
jgi:hypothetical protein